ncbi:MAG: hypothetical protein JXA90_11855, partial [Planctomycetes bacterium]|nr:hypothetical protein [Planctomycetota bacterium]
MHNRTSISLLIVLLATAPAAARDAGAGASRASDPAEAAPPAGDRSAAAAAASEAALPASWLEAWRDPPASCRPLQIVHGIDPRRARGEGIEQITGGEKTPGAERRGMGYYRDLGLGGIVCNVA